MNLVRLDGPGNPQTIASNWDKKKSEIKVKPEKPVEQLYVVMGPWMNTLKKLTLKETLQILKTEGYNDTDPKLPDEELSKLSHKVRSKLI